MQLRQYQEGHINPKEHSWGLLGPGRCVVSNREANTKGWLTKFHVFLKNSFSLKLCRLCFVKYFSKKIVRENFWKTNVKAHPGPFRPGPHLYQTSVQHSTYIKRKYSSGDRTIFNSILTVFVVKYVIVQWTYCSKLTTSMNDLTMFTSILMNRYYEYYDLRWYLISCTILSYGSVLS